MSIVLQAYYFSFIEGLEFDFVDSLFKEIKELIHWYISFFCFCQEEKSFQLRYINFSLCSSKNLQDFWHRSPILTVTTLVNLIGSTDFLRIEVLLLDEMNDTLSLWSYPFDQLDKGNLINQCWVAFLIDTFFLTVPYQGFVMFLFFLDVWRLIHLAKFRNLFLKYQNVNYLFIDQ